MYEPFVLFILFNKGRHTVLLKKPAASRKENARKEHTMVYLI